MKKKDVKLIFVVNYVGQESLGIACIVSFLKANGFPAEAVTAQYKSVSSLIDPAKVNVLAYSVPTPLFEQYYQFNSRLKERHEFFALFGGPHPSIHPEIIEQPGIDAVCIGEGEHAMLELLQNIQHGKPVRNIRNLWVKENKQVFKNSLRPLVQDLDSLPFADRTLFQQHPLFYPQRMTVMTTRGCPYGCSYCFNACISRLYGNNSTTFRQRSVGNVISELSALKADYPLKFVIFDDSLFNQSSQWIREFSPAYKKLIGIPFFCAVRPDLVKDDDIRLLKECGCHSITMGVETADDRLREDVLEKSVTREQIINAAQTIKRYGIKLRTTNIIGITEDHLAADMYTIRLNQACAPDYSYVSVLRVYPNSRVEGILDRNSLQSARQKKLVREIRNLKFLFPLAVEYRFLTPFLNMLIRLPLGRFYRGLSMLWLIYCCNARLFKVGWRTWVKRMALHVRYYLGTLSYYRRCS